MAAFMKMLQRRISFQIVSEVVRLSGIPRVIQSTNVSSSRMLGSASGGGSINGDAVVTVRG